MNTSDIRTRILDSAERRARAGGYNGFSFRDIAQDVAIKSASVHYHFPAKADLGRELVLRYTARIKEALGDPSGLDPEQAEARVTSIFRAAMRIDDKMCLCGIFGAERDALPPEVSAATADFFRMVLEYLRVAHGSPESPDRAMALLARLEGALIVSRMLGRPELFDSICPAAHGIQIG